MTEISKTTPRLSGNKLFIDFEEVFDYIGHFGVFQFGAFILMFVSTFTVGVQMISATFLAADMDHWCDIPRLQNFSHDQQKYISIPYTKKDDSEYSSCEYYDLPWSEYSDLELIEWNRTAEVMDAPTRSCTRWIYDQSEFVSTIVNEWDLVCGESWIVPLTKSISLSGVMLGAICCGFLSDRLGRVPMFVIGNTISVLAGIGCAYSPNILVYNILRWLTIFGTQGAVIVSAVIVTETVGPRHRTWAGVVLWMFFSVGFAVLGGVAFLIRDHQKLQLPLIIPNVLCLLAIWIIPESPRWLLTKDRDEDAMAVIRHIGLLNNRPLPDHIVVTIKSASDEQKQAKITDLFHHPVLRRITLILFFVWFTSSLSYYATSLNLDSLTGDVFLNTFIAGIMEFPSNTACLLLLTRIGRRFTLSGGLLIGGVLLAATAPFFDTEVEFFVVILTMAGRFGFASTFTGIFVYTSECIPTPVRNIGLGACSMVSSIGTMSSPYFGTPLQAIWVAFPSVMIGALAVLGGLLLLLLPETLNRKMPDCVEDTVRICRKKSLLLPSIYQDMAGTDLGLESSSDIDSIDSTKAQGKDNIAYVSDEQSDGDTVKSHKH